MVSTGVRVNPQVIRRLLTQDIYVVVVEHDLSVLDYLSDFICCLYGVPGAYGVVTMPFGCREGINIFLAGFIPTENLRFRDVSLSFKVSENAEEGESIKQSTQYDYPDMVKTMQAIAVCVFFCTRAATLVATYQSQADTAASSCGAFVCAHVMLHLVRMTRVMVHVVWDPASLRRSGINRACAFPPCAAPAEYHSSAQLRTRVLVRCAQVNPYCASLFASLPNLAQSNLPVSRYSCS